MITNFEEYAAKTYLPALGAHDTDEATLLAAVRYVLTRDIGGHESRLRELLTTRFRTQTGRDIAASCVDALITLTDDPVANARFLSLAATAKDPPPSAKLCEDGLQRLGPVANEALLIELARTDDPDRIRKLARLLTRVSGVRPPAPLPTWLRSDRPQRQQAIHNWRSRITEAGALPAPPPTTQPASQPATVPASQPAVTPASQPAAPR
ncbi:MAG TPA: hypothetical protein VM243_21625 [Phycisphaerae bacterium]|nr:hypothetical protein [Phycisphaerae bacterium]